MLNKSKGVKKHSKLILSINTTLGYSLNISILLLGLYFRFKVDTNFVFSLGDSGSITKTLLTSFSMVSGRSLVYLSVYGFILTLLSKKEAFKEFYGYYMLAVIFFSIGSLIYFIV